MAVTQKTVKQHFVPQLYLKNFKSSDGRLWVFNKSTGATFCSGERVVAFENGFYDLEDGSMEGGVAELWNENDQGERAMAHFDEELHRVLKLLFSEGKDIGVFPHERQAVAFAMAIQHMRTAKFREGMDQAVGESMSTFSRNLIGLNFPGQEHLAPTIDITDTMLRHEHMRMLLDPEKWRIYGDAISSLHWTFCIAPDGARFLTSDKPVSVRYHLAGKALDTTGFRSPGVEIVYPIHPKYALVAREAFLTPLTPDNGGAAIISNEQVRYCNCLVTADSQRFVIGTSKDFSDATEFLDRNPILRTRPWGLWETNMMKPRWVKTRKRKKELKQYMVSNFKYLDLDWSNPGV